MYVYGVGNGVRGDAIKKRRKTSATVFKTIDGESPVEETSTINEASSTPSISTVLALQDVDSPIAREREAFDHANAMIDDLESYRKQMLLGGDSTQILAALNQRISKLRARSDSKELEETIKHLELRSQIIAEQNKP